MARRTNAEFQQDTDERLAKHETILEGILAELKSLSTVGSSTHSGGGQPPNHSKPYMKLDFPRFDGWDPAGWLYQAEQYFDFQGVEDADKVHLASFHLDGIALQWHRWLAKSAGPMSWPEFSRAIQARFGPTDYEDPAEAITRLKQTTTVVAYQEEFERLSHRLDGLLESFLVGSFIGGLKDELRLEVLLKNPGTLTTAISVARLVEEKLQLTRKGGSLGSSMGPNNFRKSNPSTSTGLLGPSPTSRLALPGPNSFRRLSQAEAKERRDKGLCYYCDERYVPGHKCSKPQLFMICDADDTGSDDSPVNDSDQAMDAPA